MALLYEITGSPAKKEKKKTNLDGAEVRTPFSQTRLKKIQIHKLFCTDFGFFFLTLQYNNRF
jgi:hypothetical protein